MRRTLLSILGLILTVALTAGAQEQSVADAARKAREKKKDQPKATKVFTNDTIPKATGEKVNVVGSSSQTAAEGAKPEGEAAPGEEKKDEGYWRARFGEIDKKIGQVEKEVELLQRELSVQQVQYNPDPNVVLREEVYRDKINELRKKISDKQAEISQLRQQRSALEDELRRSGGNAGWARP